MRRAAAPTSVEPGRLPDGHRGRHRARAIGSRASPSTPGIGVDKIVFTFGTSTGIPSGTDPTGELQPTSPPFIARRLRRRPVDVDGQRFIAVTFRGMAVADEQGNPSYTGPIGHPARTRSAVRELRLVDDFEGVVTWIVGVDGPGCVAVTRLTGPDRIVVSVTQPSGLAARAGGRRAPQAPADVGRRRAGVPRRAPPIGALARIAVGTERPIVTATGMPAAMPDRASRASRPMRAGSRPVVTRTRRRMACATTRAITAPVCDVRTAAIRRIRRRPRSLRDGARRACAVRRARRNGRPAPPHPGRRSPRS